MPSGKQKGAYRPFFCFAIIEKTTETLQFRAHLGPTTVERANGRASVDNC
jgi:hypothetical protein